MLVLRICSYRVVFKSFVKALPPEMSSWLRCIFKGSNDLERFESWEQDSPCH